MLGLIVATDRNGVIGVHGTIPWHKPADLKRFRDVTDGSTLILGRRTWESIGKPLKNRHMLVVTHRPIPEAFETVEAMPSLEAALERAQAIGRENVWFAGGEVIYHQALLLPELRTIDLTVVNEIVSLPLYDSIPVARFPGVPPEFLLMFETTNEQDATLTHRVYERKRSSGSVPSMRSPVLVPQEP